jgi:hypothetical protein
MSESTEAAVQVKRVGVEVPGPPSQPILTEPLATVRSGDALTEATSKVVADLVWAKHANARITAPKLLIAITFPSALRTTTPRK